LIPVIVLPVYVFLAFWGVLVRILEGVAGWIFPVIVSGAGMGELGSRGAEEQGIREAMVAWSTGCRWDENVLGG
jgi:hypothetical protein